MKKSTLKKKLRLAMLAPSFIAEFDYPEIIVQLKKLGFDRIVELTFGAKLVNREYHQILENPENKKKMLISSVCPGIVETIEKEFPKFKNNLMAVDSPMIAMAKVCRKFYPKYDIVFISPCYFKKREAELKGKNIISEVICYNELKEMLKKIKPSKPKSKNQISFDRFYNDYTKIYPLAGGLSKTAHLKGVLNPGEEVIIDGITKVKQFLKKPKKGVRFLDANFCVGACLGGPCISKERSLKERISRLKGYIEVAKKEAIPENRKGLIEKAEGLSFRL
jgi:iron only hydrogenase large subunit-like protein